MPTKNPWDESSLYCVALKKNPHPTNPNFFWPVPFNRHFFLGPTHTGYAILNIHSKTYKEGDLRGRTIDVVSNRFRQLLIFAHNIYRY